MNGLCFPIIRCRFPRICFPNVCFRCRRCRNRYRCDSSTTSSSWNNARRSAGSYYSGNNSWGRRSCSETYYSGEDSWERDTSSESDSQFNEWWNQREVHESDRRRDSSSEERSDSRRERRRDSSSEDRFERRMDMRESSSSEERSDSRRERRRDSSSEDRFEWRMNMRESSSSEERSDSWEDQRRDSLDEPQFMNGTDRGTDIFDEEWFASEPEEREAVFWSGDSEYGREDMEDASWKESPISELHSSDYEYFHEKRRPKPDAEATEDSKEKESDSEQYEHCSSPSAAQSIPLNQVTPDMYNQELFFTTVFTLPIGYGLYSVEGKDIFITLDNSSLHVTTYLPERKHPKHETHHGHHAEKTVSVLHGSLQYFIRLIVGEAAWPVEGKNLVESTSFAANGLVSVEKVIATGRKQGTANVWYRLCPEVVKEAVLTANGDIISKQKQPKMYTAIVENMDEERKLVLTVKVTILR